MVTCAKRFSGNFALSLSVSSRNVCVWNSLLTMSPLGSFSGRSSLMILCWLFKSFSRVVRLISFCMVFRRRSSSVHLLINLSWSSCGLNCGFWLFCLFASASASDCVKVSA